MTPAKQPGNGKRDYQKHGLTTAKQAMRQWGERVLDQRTTQFRELQAWKDALIDDMGGPDEVTAQRLTIIDLAAKTKILLDGIDAWLFEQPSLVNKSKRQLFAVVKERQQLADSLATYMSMLGLERRAKVLDLGDYVVETYGEGAAGASK